MKIDFNAMLNKAIVIPSYLRPNPCGNDLSKWIKRRDILSRKLNKGEKWILSIERILSKLDKLITESDSMISMLSSGKRKVTKLEWTEAINNERSDSIHPCNSWDPFKCDCKGACSCHWRDL